MLIKMNTQKPLSLQLFIQSAEFRRVGNIAVHKAQEENRRLGIPNVFSINGVLYYELPNGDITKEDPFPALIRAKNEQRIK
ncbi:hypothetical protein PN36_28895 [Candidatus Thiomargarita nelsonii]|uniref:Uncharacterized protein n=1 Tax=Candidatus Thiomargarita nelsonii TaxID=1003181 RepID=A0A0A6PBE7_9GAMM|nr:hypothetical protein PN36_28895 [Candidatus Thiomargarita nelsonii]